MKINFKMAYSLIKKDSKRSGRDSTCENPDPHMKVSPFAKLKNSLKMTRNINPPIIKTTKDNTLLARIVLKRAWLLK